MEPDRYSEEAAILDRFLSENKLTEKQAWDRLIGVLYHVRDLDDGEFAAQVDPLNEAEVLLDLAELPPRPGFLRLLADDPKLNLKSLLVDYGDPMPILECLHLLVEPLLQIEDWVPTLDAFRTFAVQNAGWANL